MLHSGFGVQVVADTVPAKVDNTKVNAIKKRLIFGYF
jgi:hypothetical protein